jgi:hypothetical protein
VKPNARTGEKLVASGTQISPPSNSTGRLRIRDIIQALAGVFLLTDGLLQLIGTDAVTNAFARVSHSSGVPVGIGILELACVVVYIIPNTSILGVMLLTDYLGGVLTSRLHAPNPLFTDAFFLICIAASIGGRLFFDENRLQRVIRVYRRSGDGEFSTH